LLAVQQVGHRRCRRVAWRSKCIHVGL
jgi:hypothetical protein